MNINNLKSLVNAIVEAWRVISSFNANKPAEFEMTGPNPSAMSEFLNTLAEATKITIVKETQHALQNTINNRLKVVSTRSSIRHFEHS